MKVGYVRVSTIDQNLDLQIDALKSYGCDKIFQDKLSGIKDKRPGLEEALQYVRPGDSLVVWRLDRLGRTRGTAEIRVKIGHSDTFFPRRYFSEIFVT